MTSSFTRDFQPRRLGSSCSASFSSLSLRSRRRRFAPAGRHGVPFWEQPLTFSKTYYVDGSSPRSDDRGPGTLERPFRTIGKAAEVLQPGERVVIAAGTYRECVRPARGGTGPDQMISYEAAPGAAVIVKASEVLRDGWQPSTEPMPWAPKAVQCRIWKHELSGALFPDAYNPFAPGQRAGRLVVARHQARRHGPVFPPARTGLRRRQTARARGAVSRTRQRAALPEHRRSAISQPPRNGLPARSRGGPIMQEVGGSPDARFWVEHQGNVIHIRVPSGRPGPVRSSRSPRASRPSRRGRAVSATSASRESPSSTPATRFRRRSAAWFRPRGGHHWIIEDNTIEWANGVGLDIGSPALERRARIRRPATSHIVRGNTIRYCGVEGIGGMGTTNTLIEDNLIEWVGWQDAERAWEAAGAKFHRARNLLFRRNVIRHIRHANALWLDSGNVELPHHRQCVRRRAHRQRRHPHGDEPRDQPDRQQHHLGRAQCRAGHARPARIRRLRHLPPCFANVRSSRRISSAAATTSACSPSCAPIARGQRQRPRAQDLQQHLRPLRQGRHRVPAREQRGRRQRLRRAARNVRRTRGSWQPAGARSLRLARARMGPARKHRAISKRVSMPIGWS